MEAGGRGGLITTSSSCEQFDTVQANEEQIPSLLRSKGNNIQLPTVFHFSLPSKHINIKIFRIIILPVLLCGCKTWSLTLREEHRLRVSENSVPSKIFGRERREVTGEWMSLQKEELYDLYSTPNIIRVIKSRKVRWAGHVASAGDRIGAYRILVGRPEGKRPLGIPRHRLKCNIKKN
jgi:hypothetical protein